MRRFLCFVPVLFLLAACSTAPSGPNPQVVMETSLGTIKMELYQDKAPISVKNFLTYVDQKHYDGTIFHRVIADFMIQGGGMTPDMSEKPTLPPISNESSNGLRNFRGTMAMARTGEPDSATSQFFINVKDNQALDRAYAGDRVGYAVFGKVIDGMDVVDKIRDVKTTTKRSPGPRGEHGDVPVEPVLIKSIRRVELPKELKK